MNDFLKAKKRAGNGLLLISALLLSSCATSQIEDHTAQETSSPESSKYDVSVETHSHGYNAVSPSAIMCESIKNAPQTIEGYHPIDAVEAYPSPYSRPLAFGYSSNIKPLQNLVNKLNSGRVYGPTFYSTTPRDSWVYRMCMPTEQKVLVDGYLDTMTACNSWNFSLVHKQRRGGASIQGFNNRACGILGRELIEVNLDGYKSTVKAKLAEAGTDMTGGIIKTGNSGAMLKALNKCIDAGKDFDMDYIRVDDKLVFSCV